MRAGVLVLGPLLTKYKKAKVSLPGGCAIGTRPVDLHLFALKKLGAKIKIKDGYIIADAKKGLKERKLNFHQYQLVQLKMLYLAAYGAKEKQFYQIVRSNQKLIDLISFLKKLGCQINISGRKITIIGKNRSLKKIKHKIIFDRIEAGTYLIAGALLGKKIIIKKINPKILKCEIDTLKKMGAKILISKNSINYFKKKN